MKAAVLKSPGHFEIEEAELPVPGPKQMRVRLDLCGVCASNIPPWEGRDWFVYPFKPGQMGHEGTGYVDELGPEVENFRKGDRVAFLSNHAYAEYDLAREDEAVLIPPELGNRIFLGEPLACAMNIFERAAISPGDTVAIVGIGFLGALLAQLASGHGAKVIAIARREFALDLVRPYVVRGIAWMDDREVLRQVMETAGKSLCPVVIEAAGKQASLRLAGDLVKEMGRLVVAGYHQDGLREVNMQQWNWKGLDVINAHERDPARYVDGMRRALKSMQSGILNPDPLITHFLPLEELSRALKMTRDRPSGFMKAVITMPARTQSA